MGLGNLTPKPNWLFTPSKPFYPKNQGEERVAFLRKLKSEDRKQILRYILINLTSDFYSM